MHVNKKAQQSEKMRTRLIAKSRKLFESKGFDGVSAEEIVAAAGVTRGALYHHFSGKYGLFTAVAEESMEKLHQQISADAGGVKSPREILIACVASFLTRSGDRRVQKLLFVDAPAVMGWSEWRALDEKYGLGALITVIQRGVEEEQFRTRQPRVSAQLLLSAMIEGALLIAASPNESEVRSAVESNLKSWIATL